MEYQKQLNQLYERHFSSIKRILDLNKELSPPILINIPQSYFDQKTKLMIIGQQTQGWSGKDIPNLLISYKEFNYGESYYSSPFWNIIRKLENILVIDVYSIIWTNLNRCDFDESRPGQQLELDLYNSFPVLEEEVKILKPDILIFFSGPNFDSHIFRSFQGSRLLPVQGFTERSLAQVQHKSIPHHSYRTYHPKYLRISGLEARFLDFMRDL